MVKSIRKFIYEDFLAAIDTGSEAPNHSKGFILIYILYYEYRTCDKVGEGHVPTGAVIGLAVETCHGAVICGVRSWIE
jgi:hypothetical protein